MKSRLLLAVAAIVAGALLVLFAAGQQWGSATVGGAARQHVTVTGRQVSAGLPALALALLALVVAVVATRGLLRRVVALVGALVAVTEAVVAFHAAGDVMDALTVRAFGVDAKLLTTQTNGWWLPAALGGIVAMIAFCLIAIAGGQWQGMGSRYDAPSAATRQRDPATSAWEALDRGDDPTD